MSRQFLGWHWVTDANKRGAFFYEPEKGTYVCHYIDELPCEKCKSERQSIRKTQVKPKQATYLTNIQWKGTDLCMDFNCPCGQYSHFDGITFNYIKCFKCGQNYQLSHEISITPVDEKETIGGGLLDIDQLELNNGEN